MNFQALINQMEQDARRIQALAQGVGDEQARWKPTPEDWSILEVIHHLYDEEREDFRARLKITLTDPAQPFAPIDPTGWVTARGYNQKDLEQVLEGFLAERAASLEWLRGLGAREAPDWQAAHPTPWGEIKAGELFAAWAAHDLLHLRQLVELHYAFVTRQAQPFSPQYAGEW